MQVRKKTVKTNTQSVTNVSPSYQLSDANTVYKTTTELKLYKSQKQNHNAVNIKWPLQEELDRLRSTCVNDELTSLVFPIVSLNIKPPVTDSAGELGLAGDEGELHLLPLMLPLQLSRLYIITDVIIIFYVKTSLIQ